MEFELGLKTCFIGITHSTGISVDAVLVLVTLGTGRKVLESALVCVRNLCALPQYMHFNTARPYREIRVDWLLP